MTQVFAPGRALPQGICERCTRPRVEHHHVTLACPVAPEVSARVDAVDDIARDRDLWRDSAAQAVKNADYYRGMLIRIGDMFGAAARIADDGTDMREVLVAKVPELVASLLAIKNVGKARLPMPTDAAHPDALEASRQMGGGPFTRLRMEPEAPDAPPPLYNPEQQTGAPPDGGDKKE